MRIIYSSITPYSLSKKEKKASGIIKESVESRRVKISELRKINDWLWILISKYFLLSNSDQTNFTYYNKQIGNLFELASTPSFQSLFDIRNQSDRLNAQQLFNSKESTGRRVLNSGRADRKDSLCYSLLFSPRRKTKIIRKYSALFYNRFQITTRALEVINQ